LPEAITKAFAITNAKISFVSLVDKAANKKQFLITKADDGSAKFTTYGRILKADADRHFVTGIVYEPDTEDTQGEYMTEEEIIKAESWFMKNSGAVDIQHNFEKCAGCSVVESFVAKSDMTIEEKPVKKGSWVMTVEVTDPDVWTAIKKGEITGFSMGGMAERGKEDVDLDPVTKNETKRVAPFVKGLARLFGYDVVRKEDDSFTEEYAEHIRNTNFYTAFDTLNGMLCRYPHDGYPGDHPEYEKDETKIRQALTEFSDVITNLLTQDSVSMALQKAAEESPVMKSGRKLSSTNHKTLKGIYESLGSFLAQFEEGETDPDTTKIEKEEEAMEKAEVQKLIQEEIAKSLDPIKEKLSGIQKDEGAPAAAPATDPTTPAATATEPAAPAAGTEGEKKPEDTAPAAAAPEAVTPEQVSKMIAEAVSKAVAPVTEKIDLVMKARGIQSNLNAAAGSTVKKSEEHYLHGIL